MEIKISKNADFGTVEIYFKEKPSQVVREALKTARFRWHAVKKCWYGKPENVENVMTASSEARAVLHAISGAFKAENIEGGAEVLPNGKTAPKRTESMPQAPAVDRTEGSRDFENVINEGDVVRIEGVEGTTGKTVNGVYYVSSVSQYTDGTKHYWLHALKKANGSIYEGIGKRSESWPLHCYANNPKVRQEYKENVKNARLVGLGPVSLAVYNEFCNELKELEEAKNSYYGGNTEQLAKVSEIVTRMASENPSLETARKWRESHPVKQDGPGLRITKNGLDVRAKNGTWKHYSLSIREATGYHDNAHADEIEVWGSYYHGSSDIPAGFALDIINNSDSQTDYFEADRAYVTKEHPLYNVFKSIANGGKAYTLTDADAEALKAYTDAKKAAADAKREHEEAERAAKEEAKEQHAREVIAQYVELFPGDSYHPHVIVQWSELTAIAEHALEYAGELNDNGATVFSVEAWENITGELDAYLKEDLGYNKTKFEFIDPINDRHFIDRCDIGEGTGSYGTRARHTIKWCKEHASEPYYMKDGGACCSPEEGAQEAQMYLDCIPATFDDLNAA